jgi:hypothetical protein
VAHPKTKKTQISRFFSELLKGELKLYGMRAAFDETMATPIKRQYEPQRIVGDLLNAKINEKQARSIKPRHREAGDNVI